MTAFWLLAAAGILLTYALFWWSLRHAPSASGTANELASVLDAHRQRRRELELELKEGKIDTDQFHQLITEMDRDLLDLTASTSSSEPPDTWKGVLPVFATLAALPLVALSLYFTLGRPDLIDLSSSSRSEMASTPSRGQANAPSLDAAIQGLRKRLEANPGSIEDWVLLARAYQATGRSQLALETYRQALKLAPDNPDIQLFYAEALARSQGDASDGESQRLIRSVLERFPHHPRALWLAGLTALQNNELEEAEQYWQRLLDQMPPNSDARRQLTAVMQKAGMNPTGTVETNNGQAATAGVQVTVTLSPRLASQANPEQKVYIFARAADGPPMPLAIVQKRVRDLPVTVELDDSMAMMPQMKLSNFNRIVIGARVAKSGNAQGSAGDLEGWSKPFSTEQNKTISVVIDQVRS